MGMFDSFLIDWDDHAVELQTKRFENVLERYRLGDVVAGAPAGVRVLFDVVRLDASGRTLFGDEPEGVVHTVFLVLVHTVFTDYEVVLGEPPPAGIAARLEELKATWSDTARVLSRWTVFLGQRQRENADLERRVQRALVTIEYAQEPRPAEGAPARPRLFPRAEEERIDRGEDALVVLRSVLEAKVDDPWAPGLRQPDPLDEFRL
jgi:hypothetical protein